DVVMYVNGLPLVIVELKNATDEKATIHKAFTQIQNYKKAVPSIFYYNALCVISDGIDAKTSSLSAPENRFLSWKAPKDTEVNLSLAKESERSLAAEPKSLYKKTDLQILTTHMLK